VVFEDLVESLGMARPVVINPAADPAAFQLLVAETLKTGEVRVIIARRDCLLATAKIRAYEQAIEEEPCHVIE